MDKLFHAILLLSASGGVMTILLYVLKPIIYKLFNATLNYYMLLVSLLFFIVPFSTYIHFPDSIVPKVVLNLTEEVTGYPIDNLLKAADYKTTVIPEYHAEVNRTVANAGMSKSGISLKVFVYKSGIYLPYIWLLGMLAFIIAKTRQYLIFSKIIIKESVDIDNADILNMLHACKNELRIGKYIRLATNQVIYTPMLAGVIKPIIILPAMSMKKEELYLILKHELTHYRRRDIYCKMLMLVINSIHWFNPLAYTASRSANRLCELSCDEMLVAGMTYKERKQYGETILNVLDMAVARKAGICPAFCETKKGIKRRLMSIMNFKKTNRGVLIVSVLAAAILFGTGIIANSALFKVNASGVTEKKIIKATDAAYTVNTGSQLSEISFVDTSKSESALLIEHLKEYIDYKYKELKDKNDLGVELAQFMLEDIRKTGLVPHYCVISELLDVNSENGLDKCQTVFDLSKRVCAPGIFWNSHYKSYSSDRMALLNKVLEYNPECGDIISNVFIESPVTLLYVNSSGKISKIVWDDFKAKVNEGIDPLE